MRNLLTIESDALQNTDLINGLQINKINTIQRAVSKNEMSKINNSRKLSKIMLESYEFFKTRGKSILAENGVFWTAEDFGQKIFGFQKSYFMRMIKFGKLTDEQVKEFTDKCTQLIAEGEKPSISVPSCLDYIKQQNQSDGGEATPRETESVVLQLKYMGKKIKVTGNGDAPTIKTDFDSDDMVDLKILINIVQEHINDR
tara:strand:- start:1080 stop:1679 length:600 start_codon:yes stop_codon:yes gene_type:complete